jgi:hypothetical protein
MFDLTTDIDFIEKRIKEQNIEISRISLDTKSDNERKNVLLESAKSQLDYFTFLKNNLSFKDANFNSLT